MQILTSIQLFLIVSVIVYLTANMIYLVRLEPVTGKLDDPPMVSVCVPARDEERGIAACLESLLAQDYPRFEVIAVNDHSSDRTGELIRELAEKDSRLIALDGKDLPQGWLGKPFALHQAFQKSKGDILLFTDADPVFKPHALSTAISTMREKGLDALTLMPQAEFGSFWERAVQPVIFGFIASLTRFRKVNSTDHKSAMGFGAFLMFTRSAYETIGGHEGGKADVLEDVLIAKRLKKAGLKLLVADAKRLFSIRMYYGFREIWSGWRKNMFLAMKRSVLRAFYYVSMVQMFVITPYLVLLWNLVEGTGLVWIGLSLFGVSMVSAAKIKTCDEMGLNRLNACLFPIGAVVMAAIMLNSMVQTLFFSRTEWRGRVYSVE
ncbi:MAG: glycosyltransferase [Nitrospinae bacterium]|nr:glycosyltransferase [Nitrospinota bacterium]MZH41891.1 glycosyltransferase [Nitrospinota bacterium]